MMVGEVSDCRLYSTAHLKRRGKESRVEKCLRGGASVGHPEWAPQRMVLVTDDGKTIWIVENPGSLEGFAGRHVAVDAMLRSRTKSVRVLRLRAK